MLNSLATLFCFGCLTGGTTVLFGFGGGFVTVPVVYATLVVGGRWTEAAAMHAAVATSAAVMAVNATAATVGQWRAGRLRRAYLWPLGGFVAAGAIGGALLGARLDGTLLRWLFAAYLLATLADSLLRRGFLAVAAETSPRPLGRLATGPGGLGIGLVAAGLGVGGSVLTVPLLRRRGLPMAQATAAANPLSVPVALAGTLVYALTADADGGHHPGQLGSIDLPAAAALLAGALPAVALTTRLAPRVPDRIHAAAYLALLLTVLAVTLLIGHA